MRYADRRLISSHGIFGTPAARSASTSAIAAAVLCGDRLVVVRCLVEEADERVGAQNLDAPQHGLRLLVPQLIDDLM
jgi:hypothetical protein